MYIGLHRRDGAFALNRHRHGLARMASLLVTSPSPRHSNVSRRRLPGFPSTLATGSLSLSRAGPAVYPLLILFDASSRGLPRGPFVLLHVDECLSPFRVDEALPTLQ